MDMLSSAEQDNQESVVTYLPKPEPAPLSRQKILKQFLISLALFGAAWYFFVNRNIELIVWLAIILCIHELGHYLAMKIFKYQDLAIFFIPMLGAAASGSKEKISQRESSIILLAGPVPGIITGILLFFVNQQIDQNLTFEEMFEKQFLPRWLPYAFVLVNLFNLLPIYPLDGGRLVRTLFMPERDIISNIFTLLSAALVAWYAIENKDWFLLIIPVLLLIRFATQRDIQRVRERLDETGLDYRKSYSSLTDEEYWRIREELRNRPLHGRVIADADSGQTEKEKTIMNVIRQILVTKPVNDLSLTGKLLVVVVWIAAVAAPLLLMDRIWQLL